MGIFGIGISALSTAQAGLMTTGHNISNANTAGFHRQETAQSTNIPLYSGSGFFGQGVHVTTVKRLYSDLLEGQVMQAQSQSGQLESYFTQIKQIDNMLADPSAGLSPALQDFFSGIQEVATNPSSTPSRQSMLSSVQALVSRFQTLDQRFKEIRDGVNTEITSRTGEINSYAQQIANINHQISLAQSASTDQQPANDLLDQRDQLIGDLNKIVKVSSLKQDDGSMNIFIGNGQPLVLGLQPLKLVATPSSQDPERLEVGLDTGGGNIVQLGQGSMDGGSLGGVMAFRFETLDQAQNALGRVAIGLAQTFNDQHRLGMDMNGALGGALFSVPPPKVIPNTTNPVGANVAVAFNNVGVLTTSDYQLNYNGATWSLLNTMTNQAVAMTGAGTVASPFVADGLSFVVTPPTVATNSASFLIKPTINGARDISVKISDTAKIAAAAPIKTASATLTNIGSGQISAGVVNSFNNKVTITFNGAGTAYDVVDNITGATLAKNAAFTSPQTVAFNGWSTTITGVPAGGDVFAIDKTVTSTASATATIGNATLASPSPVDPNLTNNVRIIFGSANTYHLAGATNNFTGTSTIVGTNVFMSAASLAAAVGAGGSNPGFTGVATGATTIGTAGSGSYGPATGTTTTISGGTISGPVGTVYTITGATLTVGDGTSANTTTVSGLTISVDTAVAGGTITIQDPAAATSPIASTFTYTGKPATGSYTTNQPISFNGWTVQISGAPAAGDSFTVGANTGGIADNRNGLLLAQLQSQNTLAGGTASYQGAYGQLVSLVGNKTREVEVTAKAQANLVSQTQQIQQSLSGVNLDEEAANLMRYQQAYQAAGKMIQIASTLFDTLISLGR